jgi:hypothetical protein
MLLDTIFQHRWVWAVVHGVSLVFFVQVQDAKLFSNNDHFITSKF